MLQPEMKKLLLNLQGQNYGINKARLIEELEALEDVQVSLAESLSAPDDHCPTCGRVWRRGGHIG